MNIYCEEYCALGSYSLVSNKSWVYVKVMTVSCLAGVLYAHLFFLANVTKTFECYLNSIFHRTGQFLIRKSE